MGEEAEGEVKDAVLAMCFAMFVVGRGGWVVEAVVEVR